MESLAEQYGFDDTLFISETPDYLKCVICQLVLRDPIQILTCGHKFCSVCFERMKNYAKNMNTEFRCPVDRDLIDFAKVCEDIGIKRVIGNLQIKCVNYEKGCSWNGDLSEMKIHKGKCEYRRPELSSMQGNDEVMALIKDLYERVGKCEGSFTDKEKEMAYLKFNLQEMKDKFNERLGEVDLLKKKNENIERELKLIKNEQEQDSKRIEAKVTDLTMKNEMLEQKVDSLENQLLLSKSQLQGNPMNVTTMKKNKVEVNREEQTLHSFNKTATAGTLTRMQGTTKKIVVSRHRGCPTHVTISNNHHIVFKDFSTVSVRTAVVPRGKKGWYEVTFIEGEGYCSSTQIGWVTSKFTSTDNYSYKGVGDCSNGYAFDGNRSSKFYNGQSCSWGKHFTPAGNRVLGVAADMKNGQLLFGLDGDWNEPMGVAFDGIDTSIGLFPAISAHFK